MPRGLKITLLASWSILAPATLVASLFFYTNLTHQSVGLVLGDNAGPNAPVSTTSAHFVGFSQSFGSGDARPYLVENFLTGYHSPMAGNGELIVQLADKYKIDWRLVPAIAFQESNLGRVMPKHSFNAWGWAIYTGKDSGASFSSWPDAIDKVTRGLARDYYGRGLKTPTQIQTRYTPDSNGSWAKGVQEAMDEIAD